MFYLIHKPIGFTSFDVIRKLRGILGVKKMWHTGTLDPLATGCLLIATGNSTKLIPRLESDEKTYLFTVDISIKSPSLDLWTEVLQVDMSTVCDRSNDEIIHFLQSQTRQLPPKYSAIHIGGRRAYHLARSGKEFEIEERDIRIKDIEIVEKKLPIISIRLTISSGWYIRSFAPIIGDFFGTRWWCITELCREKIGVLDIRNCSTIEDCGNASPLPYTQLFPEIQEYTLDSKYKRNLLDGVIIPVWTPQERSSEREIFITCDDVYWLAHWTEHGIEVIKNYV